MWADGYRILIELSEAVSREVLEDISKRLFSMPAETIERKFLDYAQRRFPFAYSMKFIAQRFGAIPRCLFLNDRTLFELSARFESTPIHEETLRESMLTRVDLQKAKMVLRSVAEGKMEVVPVLSEESPTTQGFYMLNKLVEIAEMVAPETTRKDNLSRMKASLLAQKVELLCLQCGSTFGEGRVEELPDFPKCGACGSGLVAPTSKVRPDAVRILQKWKSREELTEEERAVLSRARRAADLVLSYGKQAIVALLTWGVGPQTAANVLANMHVREEDFYADLLKVKLRYIQTRPFWD